MRGAPSYNAISSLEAAIASASLREPATASALPTPSTVTRTVKRGSCAAP